MAQQLNEFNLQRDLASALWYPGQSEAEWQAELAKAVERQYIIGAFLRDEVETDSFLDWAAQEIDDPFVIFAELPEPPGLV